MTPDQIQYIRDNYLELGPTEIGKHLSVSYNTVTKYARQFGLIMPVKKQHRFTAEQCTYINERQKNTKVTLKEIGVELNEKFGLSLSYQSFMKSREAGMRDGTINSRYEKNYFKHVDARDRNMAAQNIQIIHRRNGGCETCGAPTDGKYCEKHARLNFKRDMSSPREGFQLRRF